MPIYTGEEPIKATLSSPRSLYVLCGSEPFYKDLYVRRLIAATVAEGLETFNLKKLDGAQNSVAELLAAADQLPLMDGRTCVIARRFPLEKLSAADCAALQTLAARVPESTVLVFVQEDVNFPPAQEKAVEGEDAKGVKKARKDMFDAFLKHAYIAKLDRLQPRDLARVLSAGARRRGCVMSPQNAALLTELCGTDLYLLQNELDKLCALAPGGEITSALIRKHAIRTLEYGAFELTNSLFARDVTGALRTLELMLDAKERPENILGQLIKNFLLIYDVKLAQRFRKPDRALPQAFPSVNPNRWGIVRKNAANLPEAAVCKCLDILNETDIALKSRGGSERILMEQTLVKLGALLC